MKKLEVNFTKQSNRQHIGRKAKWMEKNTFFDTTSPYTCHSLVRKNRNLSFHVINLDTINEISFVACKKIKIIVFAANNHYLRLSGRLTMKFREIEKYPFHIIIQITCFLQNRQEAGTPANNHKNQWKRESPNNRVSFSHFWYLAHCLFVCFFLLSMLWKLGVIFAIVLISAKMKLFQWNEKSKLIQRYCDSRRNIWKLWESNRNIELLSCIMIYGHWHLNKKGKEKKKKVNRKREEKRQKKSRKEIGIRNRPNEINKHYELLFQFVIIRW